MGLYIETRIRGTDLDTLWERTQEPAQHQRWDLRFTSIDYLEPDRGTPRRFRYALRVLPGLVINGTGVAAGEKQRPDGTRTSALRFSSTQPLSPLAEGRGYWRYGPNGDDIRFLTGYDYAPGLGAAGRATDRLLLRPLMGWATAWSFDRLRLWCERGQPPERSRARWQSECAARVLALLAAAEAVQGGHPLVALAVSLAALLLPPAPGTPAARRCLRRPPGRAATDCRTTAPALLAQLEQP